MKQFDFLDGVDQDIVLVDSNFIREELTALNTKRRADYELLHNYFNASVGVVFIGQNINADIQPMENFKTRLAVIGWNVMAYSINRRMGDTPNSSGLMAGLLREAHMYLAHRKIVLITGDRGIIPVVKKTNDPFYTFSIIGPESWTTDPLALQAFDHVSPLNSFIDHIPAMFPTEGDGKWDIEEEFTV